METQDVLDPWEEPTKDVHELVKPKKHALFGYIGLLARVIFRTLLTRF